MRTLLAALVLCAFSATAGAETDVYFSPRNVVAPGTIQVSALGFDARAGCSDHRFSAVEIERKTIRVRLQPGQVCVSPSPFGGRAAVPLHEPGRYEVQIVTQTGEILATRLLTVRDAAPSFSAEPDVGLAEGGEVVHLTGYGIGECSSQVECDALEVRFGDRKAVVLSKVKDRIIVVVPAGNGPTDITIRSGPRTHSATNAFYYLDRSAEADPAFFRRVLFPVLYSGPGAYDSKWSSEAAVENLGSAPVHFPSPRLFGSFLPPGVTRTVHDGQFPDGVIVLEPRNARVSHGLLARDLTRQASAAGTEIPVVPEEQFFQRPFSILNVPSASRYRLGLRFYGFEPFEMNLRVGPMDSKENASIPLIYSATDAESGMHSGFIIDLLARFPQFVGRGPLRVMIYLDSSYAGPGWAFVTVTSNDTQHVTVISPQ